MLTSVILLVFHLGTMLTMQFTRPTIVDAPPVEISTPAPEPDAPACLLD